MFKTLGRFWLTLKKKITLHGVRANAARRRASPPGLERPTTGPAARLIFLTRRGDHAHG
jgi:hypothetical protein